MPKLPRDPRHAVLAAEGAELCAIHSVPVPVVSFPHTRHAHRWYGEAAYGRVSSKKQTSCGFKLHLRASRCGLVLAFALAAASHADGGLAEQRLIDKAGLTVLGDKDYLNGPLQQRSAARNNLALLTPKRRNQATPQPPALTHAINHFRQIVETVNSRLVGQCHLQRNRAKSLFGPATRHNAKLAAHTLGLDRDYRPGRSLLALMNLTLISRDGYRVWPVAFPALTRPRAADWASGGKAAGRRVVRYRGGRSHTPAKPVSRWSSRSTREPACGFCG